MFQKSRVGRVMKSIRVTFCLATFLRVPRDVVTIVKDNNKAYSGWTLSARGSVVSYNFIWVLALVHLLACEYCRQRLGLDLAKVKREFKKVLKSIEEEAKSLHTFPIRS